MPIVSIIAGLIAVVAAVVITYYVTVNNLKKDADSKIGNAENKAREIIDDALKNAEAKKKETLLEIKEESIKTKNELEKETKSVEQSYSAMKNVSYLKKKRLTREPMYWNSVNRRLQ